MKKENWIEELKNLKLSGWYLEGTEIPVEIVDFIEKLLQQEKSKDHQKFIEILEELKTKEKYPMPVVIYELNQKIQKIINQLKDKK